MGKKSSSGKHVRIEKATANEVAAFLFNLGNQFTRIRNAEMAFGCYKYSLELNPELQQSVFNLGVMYTLAGNLEGAERMFREASKMRPDDIVASISLAETLRKQSKLSEALELVNKLIGIDPENYAIRNAMAILKYDMGNVAEAMEWNTRALELKPNDFSLQLNHALINMTYGQWDKWWWLYERCLSYGKNEKMRNLRIQDSWGGQEVPGGTLAVISDQGYGDAIQFSRYLADAKERGKFGKLTYYVQPDVVPLLSGIEGPDEVVPWDEREKMRYDAFSSLLGVMRVLGVNPENCRRPPHLVPDQKLAELWRHRVSQEANGCRKRVGIVWGGDPKHGNDHARSLPLAKFAPVLLSGEQLGIRFFSFQVGSRVDQLFAIKELADSVVELGTTFRNFADTGAALRSMDLLISCDTSVAHLAGCMGVPCWVLLPNPSEWRWLMDRADSPWYECVRLFRQRSPKSWAEVVDAVGKELMGFAA